MRLRSHAVGGGWAMLGLIVAGAIWWGSRGHTVGVSLGAHGYQRQAEGLSAALVLTNTGAVSLAVPLRFECEVPKGGGSIHSLVDTPSTVFLPPGQQVILSNTLWLVRLPADTSAWRVKVRFREMSRRERLVDALRQSGLVNDRTLSRLLGQPGKETDYWWREYQSAWLEVPHPSAAASTVADDE